MNENWNYSAKAWSVPHQNTLATFTKKKILNEEIDPKDEEGKKKWKELSKLEHWQLPKANNIFMERTEQKCRNASVICKSQSADCLFSWYT